jgi:predicted dehydrogenase
MADLKVGLVGCGRHAYYVLQPALRDLGAEVVAACDARPEALARFTSTYRVERTYSDYRALLEKERLDALVAVTGPESHPAIAMAAMKAGLDVFVEKTPARTSAEAEAVVAAQRETGRWTMVGFNRRYATGYRMAKAVVDERAPAYLMQSRYHAQDYGSEERFVVGHLIHHLDLARYFLGEIRDVQACRVFHSAGKLGYSINLTAESGAVANVQSASMLNFNYPQEHLQIMGVGWEVIVDNHQDVRYNRDDRRASLRTSLDHQKLDETRDSLLWSGNRTMFPPTVYHDQGFRAELELFIGCVRGRKAPEYTMADSLRSIQLMEAFQRAIELQD